MSEYCLRWNNHRPNLVTVFSELLTSEALVDVTLATDGHYIHAHKLVLSACSVYFKDLFGANPCKHPIVILKDIRIEDLKTVIDFIYRGEVNVAQDRLQDVLRTAESLRIKGLAENPRSYDEMSSHGGTRFSSSTLGSQVTRQRSSLTDSREQSLSLEGEEEGEPGTPPTSKRRKITASHDSSESVHEEGEGEERGRPCDVKDEPVDEHDDKMPSRDQDHDISLGAPQDTGGGGGGTEESSGAAPGTSADPALAASTHAQGAGWLLPKLSPWWASVLPALSRQQQQQQQQQQMHPRPGPPPFHPPPLHPSMAHLPSMRLSMGSGAGRGQGRASPGKGAEGGGGSNGGARPLDQVSLAAMLGKEVSPQMVQALQAVAARRESFSSAAKLYAVSVTTLWRYSKKLGLSDSSHK